MAKIVASIVATVEHITGIKSGQYGEYRSVLFKDPSGEKIWKSFDPEAEELGYLSKGIKVQLIPAGERNGKTQHNIVLLENPASVPQAATATIAPPPVPRRPDLPPTWSNEQKREISAEVCDHADVLHFCLEVVQHKFADVADPRDFRALATTLYIQIIQQRRLSESATPSAITDETWL